MEGRVLYCSPTATEAICGSSSIDAPKQTYQQISGTGQKKRGKARLYIFVQTVRIGITFAHFNEIAAEKVGNTLLFPVSVCLSTCDKQDRCIDTCFWEKGNISHLVPTRDVRCVYPRPIYPWLLHTLDNTKKEGPLAVSVGRRGEREKLFAKTIGQLGV